MLKKRVLSVWLCLALLAEIFSGVPQILAQVGADDGCMTVYVHDANGDDNNDGITQATPLRTVSAAINRVNELGLTGENRVITILSCGWNGLSFDMSGCNAYEEMIILRSGITVWTSADMKLAGPITLDTAYGNSVTQKGVNIYTYGYDLVLGERANDAKGTTSVYAGFSSEHDSAVADIETGYIEFGRDINVTVATKAALDVSLYIGNATWLDSGAVQYGDANIIIDAPNATVKKLAIGNAGNYATGIGVRMNRYESFNLIVNNISEIASITGGTYYNGSIAVNMQLVYNNGTYSKVVADSITFGNYYDSIFTVTNKWVMKDTIGTDEAYLRVTDKAGVFAVEGLLNAAAESESNEDDVYMSVNGLLEVPDGSYLLSYTDPGSYIFADNTFTAVTDISEFDISQIAPVQKENLILLGWSDENGEMLADTASVSLAANQKLYAVYTEFDVNADDGVADFYIAGIQLRTVGKSGLRFIIHMADGFSDIFSRFTDVKYGYLALPQYYTQLGEALTVGNELAAQGNHLESGFVYYNDEATSFTVCITGISENRYGTNYDVCGFVTYTDLNGNERTVYSQTASCSLLEAASQALLEQESLTSAELEYARDIVEKGLQMRKTQLSSTVGGTEDTVAATATGTVYYVSENGSDANCGTSQDAPWATLERVQQASLSEGDVVLFERGGQYRTYIKNGMHMSLYLASGVSYGAYGTGDKPLINGSAENYADRTWLKHKSAENVYYIDLGYTLDPGVLRVTTTKNYSYTGCVQDSLEDLDREWEFYWEGSVLYMYCQYANPGSLLKDIEIGFGTDAFKIDGQCDIVVENLAFSNVGRHAIGGTNHPENITIRGCVFSYIGGSLYIGSGESDTPTRLGNGVEFLGSSSDILIESCSFYSIYDSGVTFQGGASAGVSVAVNNFTVRSCVFDKCGLGSFEYWLGEEGTAKNILIENNYMANVGMGHGGINMRMASSINNAHIRADGTNKISGFCIENNVFDSAADGAYLIALCCNTNHGGAYPSFAHNVYEQSLAQKLMTVCALSTSVQTETAFDADAYGYLKANWDTQPIVIYN